MSARLRGAQLNLIVLRCADIEAARRFYTSLGLDFAREQHGTGPEHFAAKAGDVVLELYPESANRVTRGLRLGFVTDVGEGAIDALVASGGRVRSSGMREGVRVVVIEDPDGHIVELLGRAEV